MGSASREALANVTKLLASPVAEGVAIELLNVAAQLQKTPQLATALTEQAPAEAKVALVNTVFKSLTGGARNIIATAAAQRWSNVAEFISGLQALGIRAAAATNPGLDEELVSVANAIDTSHELELSLGSKLAAPQQKTAAVKTLFADKISATALAIVQHLVANPASGRPSPALREAATVAADQAGYALAEVTVVAPLDQQRAERLRQALGRVAGRPVKISTVIDPTLVGGLRVKIADEIIDGSVSARLNDLRLQLAG